MKLAPIVLFTFNRPEHTRKTLKALSLNEWAEYSNLYVFSDGPRNDADFMKIDEVREIINSFKLKKKFLDFQIFEGKENKGLANSVIDGVSRVFSEHNSVIVLEDDLITSVDFIKYMNEALNFYENANAGAVTGYNPLKLNENDFKYRAYAMPRSCSFGWGTWKHIWEAIDWDVKSYEIYRKNYFERRKFNQSGFDRAIRLDRQMKKNVQSWSVRFGYNLFKMNKLIYYPVRSKITPNGWDGSGIHSASGIDNFNIKTGRCNTDMFGIEEVDLNLLKRFRNLYGYGIKAELKELLFWVKNRIR